MSDNNMVIRQMVEVVYDNTSANWQATVDAIKAHLAAGRIVTLVMPEDFESLTQVAYGREPVLLAHRVVARGADYKDRVLKDRG